MQTFTAQENVRSPRKRTGERDRDRKTEMERNKERGNNTVIGQNYLLLPSALFLIRVKPTALEPSMCKSQLKTERDFLQGEWTKLRALRALIYTRG